MKKEEWKPVVGFEGIYEVSSIGRVKSLANDKLRKEKILKPSDNGKGYLQVCLCRDGKGKMFKIHRLVASAFLPNPFGFTEINHIDEDKANNVVSNIEWASRLYNNNYGSRNKKISKAKSRAVEASRFSDFRTIELRFSSTREADRNGYNSGHVSTCCNGCYCSRGNFYKKLYWRFEK